MKILCVIPYFVPAYGYGGPLKVCFEVSKGLRSYGHDITVITTDALDGNSRIHNLDETIEGVHIIRFRNVSNWLAKRFNGYLPIGFYSWLKKNIDQFDVVYCHDFFTYQNLIVSRLCNTKKIPFILQPHGALSRVRQLSRFFWIKRFIIFLFGTSLKHAKALIALTQSEKNDIIALQYVKDENIAIIPNGLDISEFDRVKKVDLHQKFGIPRNHSVIGYFGRLQYIKGVDISLEVLHKLVKRVPFTYLIIGPDDGEKASLLNKIEVLGLTKNVIFTGLLEGDVKLSVVKSCDLCLFTSRSEGLPMTVLEIAALGVPQVISSNCNVPEIESHHAGFIFGLNERDAMAVKIYELLTNKDVLCGLSLNSIRMARSQFDIRVTIDKIERILSK